MKKYLDKIFILVGILIIAWSLGIKLVTNYKEKKLIEAYRESMVNIQNTEDHDNKYDETYGENKYEVYDKNQPELNTKNSNEELNEQYNKNIIGIIEIPKIELTAPIGNNTEKETLKYSVGHFEKTEMPGEKGNCCIIGHRSYTYGEFFNRLDEIENGDNIIVTYNNHKYNYIVKKKFVVEPEDVTVLENDKDIESEITLITCTPLRVGTHRLIIKCKLES